MQVGTVLDGTGEGMARTGRVDRMRIAVRPGARRTGLRGLFALAVLEAGVNAGILKVSGPVLLRCVFRQIATGHTFVALAVDMASAMDPAGSTLTPVVRGMMLPLIKRKTVNPIAIDLGGRYKTVAAHPCNAERELGSMSEEETLPVCLVCGLGRLLDGVRARSVAASSVSGAAAARSAEATRSKKFLRGPWAGLCDGLRHFRISKQ